MGGSPKPQPPGLTLPPGARPGGRGASYGVSASPGVRSLTHKVLDQDPIRCCESYRSSPLRASWQ